MHRAVTVYGLCLADDPTIRYVGQTVLRLAERRRLWVTNARADWRRAPIFEWVRRLADAAEQLRIVALEPDAIRDEAERRWIAGLRAAGVPLLNVASGGAGCPDVKPSAETRKKRSESVKADWAQQTERVRWIATPEQHARQVEGLRRNHPLAWLGRRHTAETKEKMAQAARARWADRKAQRG